MWRRDDDIQTMLRESAENFATMAHDLQRVRRCRVSAEGHEPAVWTEMAALGWTGAMLPEQFGGAGLGLAPALTLAEIWGRHLVSEPLIASSVMAATVLSQSSSDRALALAAAIAEGGATASLAYQEELGVLYPSPPKTIATREAGAVVLSGRKIFVPCWSANTHLLVTARLDDQTVVIAIDPQVAEAHVGESRRMTDGSISVDLEFRSAAISADDVILMGGAASQAVDLAIARGMLALSAQMEGLCVALLKMTGDYVLQRVQFGQPLGSFQSIRHSLANLYVQVELAGAAWRSAASALEDGPLDEARGAISSAKARASDTALAVAKAAIQYHGAFGYTEEADVGLYVNCALRLASWLGNAPAHRALALRQHQQRQASHA